MALFHGTLRSRLAALNLAVFGIILSAVCILVLMIGENYLRQDFDEWLTSLATSIASDVAAASAIPFESPGLYLQLRESDGQVAARSRNLKDAVLPLDEQAAGTRNTENAVLQTISDGSADSILGPGVPLRMLTLHRATPGGPPFYLQVAVSEARLNNSLRRLHRLIIALMISGMLAVGLASWLLARRALAPIGKMSRDLRVLSAAHLDRRITVPAEGDEVSEMAATANQMLDRLETAFLAQQQFLGNAAHELKTPVTVLLGQAQVLGRQPREPRQYEEFVESVGDEMRRMGELIDGLLTLARAHAGFPIPLAQPVSLNEAVTDALQRWQPLASERGVRLVLRLPPADGEAPVPTVLGDSELLSLMVGNLIRNAIRYSPEAGTVEIELDLRGTDATIFVRDRGPGIPGGLHERVFEPFFRVSKHAGQNDGAGLGLSIAKGIAELHQGRIEASNRADGGCEFRIDLPLVAEPIAASD
jgi:signal transduction histidine kinase